MEEIKIQDKHTFRPYLSENSRRLAFAKFEKLGNLKTEDRLFEQHCITQEKLKFIREKEHPKFKPQIDKNSRNIIKLKRSQMSSANSSIINEII